jgi:hypothetical protein
MEKVAKLNPTVMALRANPQMDALQDMQHKLMEGSRLLAEALDKQHERIHALEAKVHAMEARDGLPQAKEKETEDA